MSCPSLLALTVIAAACGQKAGVAGTGGEGDGGGATVVPPPLTPTTASGTPTTAAEAGSTVPGSATAGSTTPAAPATTAAVGRAGRTSPVTTTPPGSRDTEIVIGIHAPVTGASPIPQESFDVGKDIYWQFLAESAPRPALRRAPSASSSVTTSSTRSAPCRCAGRWSSRTAPSCSSAAGGADQITACAQYANENGIPYLSAGVNEDGLADLDTYFATSMTYAEQAPLIVAQLQEQGLTEAALVVADTPSFEDAYEAYKAALTDAGIGILYENRINKDASPAESATVAQQLKDSGAPAVILLASPVVYVLGLAPGAASQSYAPVWIGPGVTSGLNTVAAIGCPSRGDRRVLLADASAGRRRRDRSRLQPPPTPSSPAAPPADDVGFQLWSMNKAIAVMLEATGPELGRAAFMNTLVTTPEFDNGIYAPLRYTVDDHFGGTGAYLLTTDCSAARAVRDRRPVRGGLIGGRLPASSTAARSSPPSSSSRSPSCSSSPARSDALVIGLTTGSAYGMVALGLVLIYKSSGVFNFAQGEFGTVAVFALYLLDFHVPYWVALLGALVVAARMGFLTERIIIRPLFDAPRVILLVATAGVALLADRRRDLVRHRPGQADRQGLRPGRPRRDPRRRHLRPAAVADRHAPRPGDPARAVLHPHQPRAGDHRGQPGADGHRAGRHQRAPAVQLHLGAGRAARRPRRR